MNCTSPLTCSTPIAPAPPGRSVPSCASLPPARSSTPSPMRNEPGLSEKPDPCVDSVLPACSVMLPVLVIVGEFTVTSVPLPNDCVPVKATLVPLNGGTDSVQFAASVTFADGSGAPVSPDWIFDRGELANVNGAGVLTANGQLGGEGNLSATYAGLSASVPVTVQVQFSQNPAGLTASQQALFDSPDASPSGTLLYPENNTVFARGILAPELMWSGGATGDAYRIHLAEKDFEATFFVTADPPSRAPIPQDLWDAFTTTNTGDPATLEVARLSGGVAHQPMHQSWTIAPGSLRGSIYYWAVNAGKLMAGLTTAGEVLKTAKAANDVLPMIQKLVGWVHSLG